MGANKIILNTPEGEKVLIDLTGDSVTPETLEKGVTAHNAAGEPIVGTREGGTGGAAYDVTDDGAGNVTIHNAVVSDTDGALMITLAVKTTENNGAVKVGG